MWRAIASSRVDFLIGLVRCSLQPASSSYRPRPPPASAVNARIGIGLRMRFRFPLPNRTSGLKAVHHRHLHIHEHQMGMTGDHFLNARSCHSRRNQARSRTAFEIGLNQQRDCPRNLPQSGCGSPAVVPRMHAPRNRDRAPVRLDFGGAVAPCGSRMAPQDRTCFLYPARWCNPCVHPSTPAKPLLMANPRPVPPYLRVVEESA